MQCKELFPVTLLADKQPDAQSGEQGMHFFLRDQDVLA